MNVNHFINFKNLSRKPNPTWQLQHHLNKNIPLKKEKRKLNASLLNTHNAFQSFVKKIPGKAFSYFFLFLFLHCCNSVTANILSLNSLLFLFLLFSYSRSRDIPNIDRQKYLVPDDLSVANFMYVIRKRIKIEAEKSIYLFVNNKVMPATAQFISTLYEKYKDEDGFLYITYAGESTFG